MIFATGMFIFALLMILMTFIGRENYTDRELGMNIVVWFFVSLASAQYIWGN